MGNDMTFDLKAALPRLLPKAIAWAEESEAEIMHNGVSLNATGVAVARSVGVVSPERIRLLIVHQLPLPEDAELRQAALLTGLLGPEVVGLTLGYGIYICVGHESIDLLVKMGTFVQNVLDIDKR